MQKIGKTIILGIFLGIAIPFLQGIVMVFANVNDHYASFTFEAIPFLCQIFLAGFQNSLNLYFFVSILGALLLVYFSLQIKFKWVGIIIGFFLGILINLPYLILRIQTTGNLLIPMDLIYMGLALVVFCLAGAYSSNTMNDREFPRSNPTHFDKPANEIDSRFVDSTHPIKVTHEREKRSFPIALVIIPIILLPVACAASLSVAGLVLSSLQNKSVNNIPDYLWSLRINQNLSEKGFVAQQISIKRDTTSELFSSLHLVVGIKDHKEYMDYRDVMIAVNHEIFSAMESSIIRPDGLGEIVVVIYDYSIGYRIISVDYNVARDFFQGKQNRYSYIQKWKFLEDDY